MPGLETVLLGPRTQAWFRERSCSVGRRWKLINGEQRAWRIDSVGQEYNRRAGSGGCGDVVGEEY